MREIFKYLCFFCGIFFALPSNALDIQNTKDLLQTVQATNSQTMAPEIRSAYEELNASVNKLETLEQEYLSKLQDNATAMKEKEQSTANKLLGGAAMGAVGIGGMQLASGLAEKSADSAAAKDMDAYLQTFRCDYGEGLNIIGGQSNIQVPYPLNLSQLRTEYIALANKLKDAKTSLGLSLGIEANEILDTAETGLYDNAATGKTENILDTAAERAASSDSSEKIKTGALFDI